MGSTLQEVKMQHSFTQLHATPFVNERTKINKLEVDIKLLKHSEQFDFEKMDKFEQHEHISYFWSITLIGIVAVAVKVWLTGRKARSLDHPTNPEASSSKEQESAPPKLDRVKNISINFRRKKTILKDQRRHSLK